MTTAWYWVSYSIVGDSGSPIGIGAGSVELSSAPATDQDVMRLADRMTNIAREQGRMPANAHAVVLAWSRMGG